jgi:hypothetical protein
MKVHGVQEDIVNARPAGPPEDQPKQGGRDRAGFNVDPPFVQQNAGCDIPGDQGMDLAAESNNSTGPAAGHRPHACVR